MRPSFEKDLLRYNEVAVDSFAVNTEQDVTELQDKIDCLLRDIAANQSTEVSAQKEVYALQKQKRIIMDRLQQRLHSLGDREIYRKQEHEEEVVYDKQSGCFKSLDGTKEVTFGTMISDIDWGTRYHVVVTDSVSKRFAKKYLVAQTRAQLMSLLNNQIICNEGLSSQTDATKKLAYYNYYKDKEDGSLEKKAGHISEVLVKNVLQHIAIDFDLPFEIREADLFQDVEQKIDFIIRRKEVSRGVEVSTSDKYMDIGVQFSINPEAYQKKQKQVEKSKERLIAEKSQIQDIMLVCFPLKFISALRGQWESAGKPSGGPAMFLTQKEAYTIFSNLLMGVFTNEEINNFWEKAKHIFKRGGQSLMADEKASKIVNMPPLRPAHQPKKGPYFTLG